MVVEFLFVVHRTSQPHSKEAPLELGNDWVEELVDNDGGESSLTAATKIGNKVGVKIELVGGQEAAHEVAQAVAGEQESAHEVAPAKKAVAKMKAANKIANPNKKRKKQMRESIRKRLFVVYPN
jgi:hypothetical protein